MHISEGILPLSYCIGGYIGAAGLAAYGLKKTENEDVPAIAVMGAAFFTASLIHFKLGVTSVHLTLIGLTAIILGKTSILAILSGLFFQAVLFQHGGISTLGVNGMIMVIPALFCQYGFARLTKHRFGSQLFVSLAAAGLTFLSVLMATALAAIVIILNGKEFAGIAALFTISNSVLALVEALITGIVIHRLLKIKPEMIHSWQQV
jgi:cobalt/nickel transport system permease protein